MQVGGKGEGRREGGGRLIRELDPCDGYAAGPGQCTAGRVVPGVSAGIGGGSIAAPGSHTATSSPSMEVKMCLTAEEEWVSSVGNCCRWAESAWQPCHAPTAALPCCPLPPPPALPPAPPVSPPVLWLEDHLVRWPKTLLVVSHAREFLNAVCTDVLHLHSR